MRTISRKNEILLEKKHVLSSEHFHEKLEWKVDNFNFFSDSKYIRWDLDDRVKAWSYEEKKSSHLLKIQKI